MAKLSGRYGYKIGIPEIKYGKAGFTYFIADRRTDQVISCWAVGSAVHVEKLAQQYVDGMNEREDKARLENKHQKTQTMKSGSYGHVTPSANKLRGLETS